jgi:hypothetical protein
MRRLRWSSYQGTPERKGDLFHIRPAVVNNMQQHSHFHVVALRSRLDDFVVAAKIVVISGLRSKRQAKSQAWQTKIHKYAGSIALHSSSSIPQEIPKKGTSSDKK